MLAVLRVSVAHDSKIHNWRVVFMLTFLELVLP